MSGGSMNYLYSKVLHCADFPCDTPERIAFAAHLKLVAQALHDIEWVDSGDYGPGDENAAIRACLASAAELRRLHAEVERLSATCSALQDALASSCDDARDELWESGGVAGCFRARRAEAQRDALLAALKDAADSIESWAAYASEYFQTKHDLRGDIARARAAIAAAEGE